MSCSCGSSGGGNGPCGPSCSCGTVCTTVAPIGAGAYVRPRFFPGQLLTEDDLQGLSDYVVAKDRLHNRYLEGDGVACGLLVRCHPGKRGWVTVGAGYAIDCCGDDVVVSCDVDLDVNELVARMPRDASCDEPCPDPQTESSVGRKTLDRTPQSRTYTLVVVYDEQPTDPVVPYPVGDDTGSACEAGTWAPQCEASRVREGYRFELRCGLPGIDTLTIDRQLANCLRPLVPTDDSTKRDSGSFDELVIPEAWHDLTAVVGRIVSVTGVVVGLCNESNEERDSDIVEKRRDLATLRDDLVAQLEGGAFTRCDLLCEIQQLDLTADCPQIGVAARNLRDLADRVLAECICSAVNPPCAPCDDLAVVLATVTVRACEVVEVCNAVRRHVLSGRTLRYWLFPLEILYKELERLCCCDDSDLLRQLQSFSLRRSAHSVTPHASELADALAARDEAAAEAAAAEAAMAEYATREELQGQLAAMDFKFAALHEQLLALQNESLKSPAVATARQTPASGRPTSRAKATSARKSTARRATKATKRGGQNG